MNFSANRESVEIDLQNCLVDPDFISVIQKIGMLVATLLVLVVIKSPSPMEPGT